jgi:hypothetical protein
LPETFKEAFKQVKKRISNGTGYWS